MVETMAEYIEREAALKKMCESCCEYDSYNTDCWCAERNAVLKIPAADVVEVVHGRWEFDGSDFADIWKCTACGVDWFFEYDPRSAETRVNYCPECGARMDGE